ncbi:MAG: diguanylate cyclase [Ectothiorhodospiraceae bacterium]|nr:diguanylate cyclase [Ectothiorhodospiraceae bacterium]
MSDSLQREFDASCSQGPFPRAGATFQPYGCLLGLDPDWEVFRLVSGNAGPFLGRSPQTVLGHPPPALLGRNTLHALRAELALPRPAGAPAGQVLATDGLRCGLSITAHHARTGDILLELEPAPGPEACTSDAVTWSVRICAAEDAQTVLVLLLQAARTLTGQPGCAVYRLTQGGTPRLLLGDPPGGAGRCPLAPDHGTGQAAGPCLFQDPAPLRLLVNSHAGGVPLLGSEAVDTSPLALRAPTESQRLRLQTQGLCSAVALTLYEDGAPWGFLVCHGDQPRYLSPLRRQLLQMLAQTAAQHYRLLHERRAYLRARKELATRNARLKRLAHTDPVTLVANRHRMEQLLEQEVQAAVRDRQPCSLLLLDIDRFKQVNDRHGHEVGDQVLRRMAREIQQRLRSSDLLGRWGGEEFLVIAPDCTLAQARWLARRLCRDIAMREVAPVGRVTLSIGVTSVLPDDTPQRLVRRADLAMYRAKHAGRACVRVVSKGPGPSPSRRAPARTTDPG